MAGQKQQALPNFASEIRDLLEQGDDLPPVETWQPTHRATIDIRIANDGAWYYQGERMERDAIVRLFSTILRKDDDEFYLVTPHEKMRIQVDDAPFIVRLMDVEGQGETQKIHLSTNVGDSFTLSSLHPLSVVFNARGEPAPYAVVRRNLKALLSREVYYQLAALAIPKPAQGVLEDGDHFGGSEGSHEEYSYGVWSDGCFFLLS